MKTKKNIMEILKHVYLLIITFIVLTPIYYLLVTTFKSGTEAAAKPMALPSSCYVLHKKLTRRDCTATEGVLSLQATRRKWRILQAGFFLP